MNKHIKFILLFLAIISFTNLHSQSLEFFQNNITVSGQNVFPVTTQNSPTGKVKLTFISTGAVVLYFNLSLSGNGIPNYWPIRNYPVTSLDSSGKTESRYFSIYVNNPDSTGVNVTSINYGFSYTVSTVSTAPPVDSTKPVNDFNLVLYNGVIDNRPQNSESVFFNNIEFDNSAATSGKTKPDYPIQSCGLGEGFSAALSDAAFYLKNIPPLFPFDTTLISIDNFKIYSSQKNEGVYLIRTGTPVEVAINNTFYANLMPFKMSNNYPPPTSTEVDNIIMPALNNLMAVVFVVKNKFNFSNSNDSLIVTDLVTVREMSKIDSINYTFTFSKDLGEGISGGRIIESGIYNAVNHQIIWAHNDTIPDPIRQIDLGGYIIEKSDPPLPIEFVSFNSNVDKRNVNLNWITSSEKNNYGFDIERSNVKGETSYDWKKISFIQGKGNSNFNSIYNFEDRNLISGKYRYRLKQTDLNGNFQYYELTNEVIIGIPDKFSLSQNYPNPFNPVTKINFDIPNDGIVKIKIYNNSGKEVKTVLNEFKNAGYYTVELSVSELSSGVYYYKIESSSFNESKKMILLK